MMCTHIRGVFFDVHLYTVALSNGAPFNDAPFIGLGRRAVPRTPPRETALAGWWEKCGRPGQFGGSSQRMNHTTVNTSRKATVAYPSIKPHFDPHV